MFRINIITLGKNKEEWVDSAINHYLKLIKKSADVSIIYIPDIKKLKNLSELELKHKEADLIKKFFKSGYKIALSDKGKKYDSIEFARLLEKLMNQSRGSIDFVIGGIYGLEKTIIKSCDLGLSLSPMTMSHQLIRPVLLEQLYRGFSIISGGKYHK